MHCGTEELEQIKLDQKLFQKLQPGDRASFVRLRQRGPESVYFVVVRRINRKVLEIAEFSRKNAKRIVAGNPMLNTFLEMEDVRALYLAD